MKPFLVLDLGGQHIFLCSFVARSSLKWLCICKALEIASRHIATLHAGPHPLPFSVLNQQEILHAPQKKQTVGEQQNINSTWPGSPGETISFRLVNCEFTERPPYFAGILFRWMGYTPSTNLPQNRRKLIFETFLFGCHVRLGKV